MIKKCAKLSHGKQFSLAQKIPYCAYGTLFLAGYQHTNVQLLTYLGKVIKLLLPVLQPLYISRLRFHLVHLGILALMN